MLGLRQPGTPESESDGDVQSDNTVFDMDFSLAVISESFPKLKTLCLNGMCDFNCFSGLDKATLINHLEGGWPFERIPRLKSIMDFTELESITFERDFDIDPDMILYCMPRVPKLREISFHWNESLSVPLLRDSVGHLERIVIAICKGEKDTFKDVITQMGEMLPNTCVCFV
ncbi:unnamed protein product [Allacma fusca]|uniref:Uncharacterized protein n=1 Tax=Allacma fusca TaxID=39272 RepID=A0A8J2P0N8_9HEXA|nr:unnamed protein product [Allacma fusca]